MLHGRRLGRRDRRGDGRGDGRRRGRCLSLVVWRPEIVPLHDGVSDGSDYVNRNLIEIPLRADVNDINPLGRQAGAANDVLLLVAYDEDRHQEA